MNIVLKASERALISISGQELLGITNALNEVCNGIAISDEEFQTRLGCTRTFLVQLLSNLLAEAHPMRQCAELVRAWSDGQVMAQAITVYGDPAELSTLEAAEFSEQLQRAIAKAA